MTNETLKEMCGWKMCAAKATLVEAYKGERYALCPGHGRLIRKQKKADNNI